MARKKPQGDAAACEKVNVFGGQAVIEGVMMRGRHSWSVAVRRPSGGIARMSFALEPAGERHHWLKWPVIRGVVAMYESLVLGVKALGIAANIGLETGAAGEDAAGADPARASEDVIAAAVTESVTAAAEPAAEPAAESAGPPADPAGDSIRAKAGGQAFGWKEMAGSLAFAIAFAVGLFVVVPLVVVKAFEDTFSNPFVFNLVEGVIRIVLFLLYILLISLIPDLRRVFQYHGAEHKVIHAYEASGRPDAERATGYSTRHPRCGTGFLLLVMVIAVFVFAIVGKPDLVWLVVSRIVGIPLIIGISYEIGIKWLGRHPDGLIAGVLLWPGLQLQRLTTREPTPDQLEVAAAALEEVMRMEDATEAALKQAALKEAAPREAAAGEAAAEA